MASQRKALLDRLFRELKFCPTCGEKLRIFGSPSTSEIKECPNGDGTAYITGKRQGQKVGFFMEIFEE